MVQILFVISGVQVGMSEIMLCGLGLIVIFLLVRNVVMPPKE